MRSYKEIRDDLVDVYSEIQTYSVGLIAVPISLLDRYDELIIELTTAFEERS